MIRHFVLAVSLSLMALPQALALQLPKPDRGRDVPLAENVDDAAVRRAAAWLKAMSGQGIDPKLREQIEKLRKQYPQASQEELAKKLLENPAFQDPRFLKSLQEMMSKAGQGQTPNPMLPPPATSNPGRFEPDPTPPPPPMPPQGGKLPGRSTTSPPVPQLPNLPGNPPRLPEVIPPNDGKLELPRFEPGSMPRRGGSTIDPEVQARRQKQLQNVMGFWENNIGSLKETPTVRNLLVEMFTGSTGSSSETTLGDLFDPSGTDASNLGSMFDGDIGGSGWKMPELGLGKWDFFGGSSTPPSPPSGPGGGNLSGLNGGSLSGPSSWAPVIILAVLIVGGLIFWWLWPRLMANRTTEPRPLPGRGPWPVDPRTIDSREKLIQAFEYLSVQLCGSDASRWNHLTIARALREALPQAEALADPLAHLYALARYTPATEPFPESALAEARGYLCELSGVTPP